MRTHLVIIVIINCLLSNTSTNLFTFDWSIVTDATQCRSYSDLAESDWSILRAWSLGVFTNFAVILILILI